MLLNVDTSMPPLRDLGGFRGLQEEEGIGDSRGVGARHGASFEYKWSSSGRRDIAMAMIDKIQVA